MRTLIDICNAELAKEHCPNREATERYRYILSTLVDEPSCEPIEAIASPADEMLCENLRRESAGNEAAPTPSLPDDGLDIPDCLRRLPPNAQEPEQAEEVAKIHNAVDETVQPGAHTDGYLEADEQEEGVGDDQADDIQDEPSTRKKCGKQPKLITHEASLSEALGDAFNDLSELASECRGLVENASQSEGLSQTSRIQTFDETANVLEGLEVPSVAAALADIKVKYSLPKRRYMSRASRASDAFDIIAACVDVLDAIDEKDPRHKEAQNLQGELEDAASQADCCDFPGMFG